MLLGPGMAWSDTPTETRTPTNTPTITLTPTAGEGSYGIAPDTLVSPSQGNGFDLTFTAGASAWPGTGGLLTLIFPSGLGTPNSGNFYLRAADAPKLVSYSFAGQKVKVGLKNLAPGESVVLRYGQNAHGFAVSSSFSSETLAVSSYPQSLTLGAGGVLTVQPTIAIQSPTTTPTPTATLTATISPTHTETPTFSTTFTITQTFTLTPVGAVETDAVYSYPNPFDMRQFDKVTFRFAPDPDAKISVFNIAGEPVRQLSASDVFGAKGFAIWRGEDDYGRRIAGGLYFVRLKGKKTFMRKFTVLH